MVVAPPKSPASGAADAKVAAQNEPVAASRGVPADRVPTLSSAIGTFANLVNTPRSQIVNRCTLLKEVETDMANLLERVGDPTTWC